MGFEVLLHHGGTSIYAPDLPPGVRRVGMFVSRQEARKWLLESEYGDGSIDTEIRPASEKPAPQLQGG